MIRSMSRTTVEDVNADVATTLSHAAAGAALSADRVAGGLGSLRYARRSSIHNGETRLEAWKSQDRNFKDIVSSQVGCCRGRRNIASGSTLTIDIGLAVLDEARIARRMAGIHGGVDLPPLYPRDQHVEHLNERHDPSRNTFNASLLRTTI